MLHLYGTSQSSPQRTIILHNMCLIKTLELQMQNKSVADLYFQQSSLLSVVKGFIFFPHTSIRYSKYKHIIYIFLISYFYEKKVSTFIQPSRFLMALVILTVLNVFKYFVI